MLPVIIGTNIHLKVESPTAAKAVGDFMRIFIPYQLFSLPIFAEHDVTQILSLGLDQDIC